MKNPLFAAALSIVLTCATALPAKAGPSGPGGLGTPTTHTAARNLYLECLGTELYYSLWHWFIADDFFSELDGIKSACKPY